MNDPAPARRARALRLAVFGSPLLLVLAEGAFMHAGHREPYPTLLMPGFSGTRTVPDGSVHIAAVDLAVRFRDGTMARVPVRDLLAPIPSGTMMVAHERLLRCGVLAAPATIAWLRNRLHVLHPAEPATSLEVHWYTDAYRVDAGVLRRWARAPAEACTVDVTR